MSESRFARQLERARLRLASLPPRYFTMTRPLVQTSAQCRGEGRGCCE